MSCINFGYFEIPYSHYYQNSVAGSSAILAQIYYGLVVSIININSIWQIL